MYAKLQKKNNPIKPANHILTIRNQVNLKEPFLSAEEREENQAPVTKGPTRIKER